MTAAKGPGSSLYHLLVESVEDYAIFALDPEGNVMSWNPGAERFKGYAEREIVGRHFSVFYPEEDLRAQKPQHELIAAAELGRFEDEGWRIRKDGTRFWANVVITPLREPDGTLVGFAKVTRDLTARKNAEERARQLAAEKAAFEASEAKNRELEVLAAQLQQQAVELEMQTEEAQTLLEEVEESNSRLIAALAAAEAAREMAREAEKKADEANRTKAEFLAAMSHELRTPLNAIAGHVELMALEIHGKLNESQHEALNRVKRAQQHLLRLIEDLLNFARIESGKVEYRVGIVVLQDALSDVGPMIGPQVSAKNLEYSVCMPEEPVAVKADREKLVQVILNLLSNAVKFTDAGGSIGVSVRTSQTQTDARHVELMISDTGIGIPADKLETIFDPFVQLATSPSARHEGTGLGLTISRELTRGMGGDLRVESQLGQGTTFIVELPLAAREGD